MLADRFSCFEPALDLDRLSEWVFTEGSTSLR